MRLSLRLALALAFAATPGCPGPTPDGDAGLDAGPYDGGSCTADAQCDDLLFCNGAERCVGGSCAPGEAVVCEDDGMSCTTERCSESRDACTSAPTDADGDGHGVLGCGDGDDCDDADAARFPGNLEVCDAAGRDEDCVDDTLGGLDEDGDGYVSARCCLGTTCGPDCDDARSSVSPDGVEICNGLDDDCSGAIDEGTQTEVYEDRDRDGFGTGAASMRCGDAAGFATEPGDCDDTPRTGLSRNPGQAELCDGVDNDCDTRTDESITAVPWFVDADDDGFGGTSEAPVLSCAPLGGRSLRAGDCDDADAATGPGADELCNGLDDDCNGSADFPIGAGDFEDDDGDGYPDLSCGAPIGTDCDDGSASVGPVGAELCDGRDNDCDDVIDEDATTGVFFRDDDGDGWGDEAATLVGCTGGPGYVVRGGDCDDRAASRFPGAREACDAVDQDCDGTIDEAPAAVGCLVDHTTSAVCRVGACVALACEAGWGACRGTRCEDLSADSSHCGACGRRCTGAHVTGASFCVMGECTVPACAAGFGDCNGEGFDGCEADFDTSALHCGACGRACPAGPNQRATCTSGTCGVTCAPGTYDCNGSMGDGCESFFSCSCGPGFADCGAGCTNLSSDAAHCGACDRTCGAGGTCTAGTCDAIVQIVTGAAHTCIRREGGGVACWGSNGLLQLGPGGAGMPSSATPITVPLPGPATDLAATRDTTCASVGNLVYCWGSDARGELGNGLPDGTSSDTPTPAEGMPSASYRLAGGAEHVVAWRASTSSYFGWGRNTESQITFGGVDRPSATPLSWEVLGGPGVLVAGDTFTCAFTISSVGGTCVGLVPGSGGMPLFGGMGFVTVDFAYSDPGFETAHAGDGFVCAGLGGTAVCGGDPASTTAMGVPSSTMISELITTPIVGRLGGGADFTCAIDPLARVRCRGENDVLQLGAVGASSSLAAVTPTGLPRASLVSSGHGQHVCVVDVSGRLWCWGANDAGQCGVPVSTSSLPALVSGL